MDRKLTILFAPMEAIGHVNACIGLAQVLSSRGHKIVFAIDQSFEGRLTPYGFVEELLPTGGDPTVKVDAEMVAKNMLASGLLANISPAESLAIWSDLPFMDMRFAKKRVNEPLMKAIVGRHRPDLFVIDDFNPSPTLVHSNKPWVCVISANPLFASTDDRLPPGCSGFATNGDNRSEWSEFRKMLDKTFVAQNVKYNEWLKEEGLPLIDVNKINIESPYLNVYGYPEELDYTDIRPIPERWLRVDTFMRKREKQEFKIPDKFLDRDITKSKLIYLSLGSMGSVDVNLMKKFVSILAKSEHKFVVSKGPLGDTYELAANMWGEPSVPQTKVLPLVDVVITHGGNNSVTEAFSCGKPMIIMPLFADQYDNAQRVMEKGFGIRLNPHTVSEHELLDSIERLLNDKDLKHRLSVASKRIQNSGCNESAAKIIENLVK